MMHFLDPSSAMNNFSFFCFTMYIDFPLENDDFSYKLKYRYNENIVYNEFYIFNYFFFFSSLVKILINSRVQNSVEKREILFLLFFFRLHHQ